MNELSKNLDEKIHMLNENKDELAIEKQIEKFEQEREEENIYVAFRDVWPQVWNGCLANGMSLLTGISTGFSTVFITQLMADPNIKEFSKTEASWIASLSTIFGPIGAFCIGPLMDKIGRRKAIIISNILPIICWGLTYSVTDSIWPLYVARTIGGAGSAMMSSVGVYVSEISHPKVRDVMMIMIGSFVSFGTLITMLLGSYIEWHLATLCFIIISVASLISSFFLPESPLWLVSFRPSEKRLNKALILSRYFNRSQKLYNLESKRIKEIYGKSKKADSSVKNKNKFKQWLTKNLALFQERGVYKPMIILLILFFFWAFSGAFVVLMYSANIFKAIGSNFGNGFDEYTATVIIGIVKFLMTLSSTAVSVRFGRRTLLIISSSGMTLTIFTAAVVQSFANAKLDFSKSAVNNVTTRDESEILKSILTVISLILFMLFGSLAMTNVPWAMVNELLPTRARAIGSSIITSYSYLNIFFALKVTPMALDYISLSNLFFIFGTICLTAAIYAYYKIPETFGRNFQDIEKYFYKNNADIKVNKPTTGEEKNGKNLLA